MASSDLEWPAIKEKGPGSELPKKKGNLIIPFAYQWIYTQSGFWKVS